ncbi:MAG: hypothetical protein B7733_19850 [Myxococcales bacterium FL481]|nr:MAG: hypothetical protein B7733_19850 [Myxococcales bacterium FL481]
MVTSDELVAEAPSSVASSFGPAVKLGRYELIRRIAVGGMAELYLAKDSSLHGFERRVVLKCILPQHAQNPEFVALLINEARLAALLVHPNLAQVYDIGIEDGRYFVAMEHVDGHDLSSVVRAIGARDWLPLEHALTIVMGIAAGLHYAHEARDLAGRALGLVHRDVSPSNVLLTPWGGVKLVDFGIAKAYAVQPRTQVGALKGKVPYMSPEQCRSERLDRRSDIFSLGTLLWELTVGARLFRRSSSLDTIHCIARGEVPKPSTIRPDFSPALERIVMRALAPAVERRYQTAQQLQIELEDFARDQQIRVSPARLGQYIRRLLPHSHISAESSSPAIQQYTDGSIELAYPPDNPTVAEYSARTSPPTSMQRSRRRATPIAIIAATVGVLTWWISRPPSQPEGVATAVIDATQWAGPRDDLAKATGLVEPDVSGLPTARPLAGSLEPAEGEASRSPKAGSASVALAADAAHQLPSPSASRPASISAAARPDKAIVLSSTLSTSGTSRRAPAKSDGKKSRSKARAKTKRTRKSKSRGSSSTKASTPAPSRPSRASSRPATSRGSSSTKKSAKATSRRRPASSHPATSRDSSSTKKSAKATSRRRRASSRRTKRSRSTWDPNSALPPSG